MGGASSRGELLTNDVALCVSVFSPLDLLEEEPGLDPARDELGLDPDSVEKVEADDGRLDSDSDESAGSGGTCGDSK